MEPIIQLQVHLSLLVQMGSILIVELRVALIVQKVNTVPQVRFTIVQAANTAQKVQVHLKHALLAKNAPH